MTNKNALAELAEDLGNIDEGPSPESICKASRIVAVLAKVRGDFVKAKPNSKAVDMWLANKFDIISAFNKCRAIAEEGATK